MRYVHTEAEKCNTSSSEIDNDKWAPISHKMLNNYGFSKSFIEIVHASSNEKIFNNNNNLKSMPTKKLSIILNTVLI